MFSINYETTSSSRLRLLLFLFEQLSNRVYKHLLLDTLDTSGKQFEPYGLGHIRNDIVHQCQIQLSSRQKTILICVEHQSEPVEHLAYKMLEYSMQMIKDNFKAKKRDIPLIYHICIYHGSQSPYPLATDIYEDIQPNSLDNQDLLLALLSKPY